MQRSIPVIQSIPVNERTVPIAVHISQEVGCVFVGGGGGALTLIFSSGFNGLA